MLLHHFLLTHPAIFTGVGSLFPMASIVSTSHLAFAVDMLLCLPSRYRCKYTIPQYVMMQTPCCGPCFTCCFTPTIAYTCKDKAVLAAAPGEKKSVAIGDKRKKCTNPDCTEDDHAISFWRNPCEIPCRCVFEPCYFLQCISSGRCCCDPGGCLLCPVPFVQHVGPNIPDGDESKEWI